ncbi:helix-turn-helix transcriptional regulator [Marilutibacter alkalisoli]|uniref:Helix-turn-helix domain-containing protein n=1 Tax=Marilutibacter alkalisoli TaxID=2591633 RepID=A0A514BUV8_9GAMM|nr:helix-turn-helix transcriptional regulator [Lysobacter alkalisoli]QDH71147.1 helix-turn-helix domain-containing protein [Lysobacter alkalisoli]
MSNFAGALKEEVARLARKELRKTIDPMRKHVASLRRDVAALKRENAELRRELTTLGKASRFAMSAAPPVAASKGSSKPRRFSPAGLRKLRDRLGLAAADFGRLLGVSGPTVYNWEKGITRPPAEQLERIAALRGKGKREVLAALEALG